MKAQIYASPNGTLFLATKEGEITEYTMIDDIFCLLRHTEAKDLIPVSDEFEMWKVGDKHGTQEKLP